ncbi:DUF969 domain-containing protein [Caulobacter sp.]|uniref:DUF969 domain-containing protein n=1 Tax=Caulobacter sp. TaxID=78 RepID=UPI001B0BC3F4|nr:DUF969 domain-containing protein [Caulobacter sp.]MBO9544734.1 DUF969 domain-containing protein [Caulobacter sp.]
MLTLLGVAVIVLGFALRFNPLLVVIAAALTSGLAAGLAPLEVLAAFGKAFTTNRYVTVAWLVLPAIAVLERAGLREQARRTIQGLKAATPGRLLIAYLALRQISAALGMTQVAGHAQTVRPLVAPMAEAAGEPLDDEQRERVKAMTAATDNVGLFFGEDIFLAIGSILLIVGFLDQSGITVEPLHLSMWAIPSAIAAFAIHGGRLMLFDRKVRA